MTSPVPSYHIPLILSLCIWLEMVMEETLLFVVYYFISICYRDGILISSPMLYASDYVEIYVSFECCPEESYVYPYSNVECLQYECARLHVMS